MSNDTKADFVNGLIVKAPHENAPEYVKAKLSIKREELIEWLQAKDGDWINLDVKESQGGKWYAAVDNWKPEGGTSGSGSKGGAPQRTRPQAATAPQTDDFLEDDIPFITNRGRL